MNTIFLLLAQYETAEIPLERCCEDFFGVSKERAVSLALRQALPVPAYKAGGAKSQAGWFVDVRDLAALIDEQRAKAQEEWRKVNA